MRSVVIIQVTGAVLLLLPFVLLGVAYDSLPVEFPVLRGWDGITRLWAAKSVLTVFRIPVIGVVMAAAAVLMVRHDQTAPSNPERTSLRRFWLILFVTACVKSLCEGLELAAGVVPDQCRVWAGCGTIAAVVIGLFAAVLQARNAWPLFWQRERWQFSVAERVAFAGLLVLYVGFGIAPIALSGWRPG